VVEKGGACGWGWVGLEIVGSPLKSNKTNVKTGNLSVNNIFYLNYLSMEFCTIWWKVVSCICPAFCNLKLLVIFFREMLNILMAKVHVVLYSIAMRETTPLEQWQIKISFLVKLCQHRIKFILCWQWKREYLIFSLSLTEPKSVKVVQKANFVNNPNED